MTMSNGFYHDDPLAYDIVVAPELEAMIGAHHIIVGTHTYNGKVVNSHYDDQHRIVGNVEIDGAIYVVRQDSFLGLSYWLLFACKESERAQ